MWGRGGWWWRLVDLAMAYCCYDILVVLIVLDGVYAGN